MIVSPDIGPADLSKPEGASAPTGLGCLVIVARHHGLHLTVPQLIHDNVLSNKEVSIPELLKCGQSVGLQGTCVSLNWDGLFHLKKALPAIVRLKSGASMVLIRLEGEHEAARIVLQDPNAEEDALLVIDRPRFEDAWTGETILIKRNYELTDETGPFSVSLITTLVFRERWIVRDIAICALILGFLALTPILFWRLVADKVLFYQAHNTFVVLCLAFVLLIVFETAFVWLRQFLILHLTARVDVKLATYMFDKLLNLPIDFFERNQVGRVTHDVYQMWKIRNFLMGQLLGTLLDCTVLIFFLPIMFFFSPIMTLVVVAICGLIVVWLNAMRPTCRRKAGAVEAAEAERGALLVQTIHGIRTVKSLALDARHRHLWDVHVARVAKLRFSQGMTTNLVQTVVRPLERLAVMGSFAVGVYLALITNDPIYIGALFAFTMFAQRIVGLLMQMAQFLYQYDDARIAMSVVGDLINQPAEQGRANQGVRTPVRGQIEFFDVTFRYKDAASPALEKVAFEVPAGTILGVVGRSGSGKTTITRLLQRLYSNYEGLIKVDGIDVREYDVDHLRRSLGVVMQENFLFKGTIRENIVAAKSDASFDEVVTRRPPERR